MQYHELALQTLVDSLDDDAIARCETVLNITSSELERVEQERIQDVRSVCETYLDSQLELHQLVSALLTSCANSI